MKCVVCIRNNERKYRKDKIENPLYEAVVNSHNAVTVSNGFAVCEGHIHDISGCYTFH